MLILNNLGNTTSYKVRHSFEQQNNYQYILAIIILLKYHWKQKIKQVYTWYKR